MQIGDRLARAEDHALLTGRARFVDDLRVSSHPDALHAVFVRSTVAHATLRGIDAGAALALPGVVGVLTAADLGLGPVRGHHMLPNDFDRPPLAEDRVRFVGEPVAVVVARTRQQAHDAIEAVSVDYEPLPDPAAPLFATRDSNVAFERIIGEREDVLTEAATVVEATFVNQRVASAPMEPDGALAVPRRDGVDVWASTQRVHHVRDAIASSLGWPHDAVRVVAPHVGGGFGGKFEPSVESVVVAAAAHWLGRPVAWVQSRTENLLCMPHGRGQRQRVAVGLCGDGELAGIWAEIDADAGAFPMVGALVPNATLSMLAGPYRWRAGGRCRSVATNTTPVGAFRGAGRPEATAAIERSIDLLARRAGIDPLELRLRNLVPADAFPYTSPTGMAYDSGDYERCLREAARRIGYDAVRQAQRAEPRGARRQGVAVVAWLDCTPMNRPGEYASLRLVPATEPPGYRVEVRDGANDQGQSHQTTWALVLADRLRIDPAAVLLHGGDTAAVPKGEGTGSARSAQLAGNAVAGAAVSLLDEARSVAADLLEAADADIVLDDAGRFAVRGAPSRSVGWADVAAAGPLEHALDFEQPGPTYPSGAHAAVVEVDTETGAVELLRFVAVDDCGTVINPVAVEGQQHGGIAQGIGQALLEHVQHDADGTPRTTTFADYLVPSATELCAIDATTIDLASPVNPIGAKGIGQAGAIGATAAVQNAVLDALAPLGVEHVDLPLTPERVWRAIHAPQTNAPQANREDLDR